MASNLEILKSLAADCREQREHDIAQAIDEIISDIEGLCKAIDEERKANDSGDTIDYIAARVVTNLILAKFASVEGGG